MAPPSKLCACGAMRRCEGYRGSVRVEMQLAIASVLAPLMLYASKSSPPEIAYTAWAFAPILVVFGRLTIMATLAASRPEEPRIYHRLAGVLGGTGLVLQIALLGVWFMTKAEIFVPQEFADSSGLGGLPGISWFLAGTLNFSLLQPAMWSSRVEAPVRAVLPRIERATSSTFMAGAADKDQSCAICLCGFAEGEGMRRLLCSHSFHDACISRWLRRRNAGCPFRCTLARKTGKEVDEEEPEDVVLVLEPQPAMPPGLEPPLPPGAVPSPRPPQ